MRLLQTEIDVTPGNRPNRGARPEGWVGEGSAVVEITNVGDLENAFIVRLECDHAYWQPAWARFDALPPQGDGNKPPVGKPDLPGPKNSTIKLHLSRGTTRQALLSFTLPRTSEARAGVYNLRVVVETAVPGANKTERFTEFPATLIVRPFYEFAVEGEPHEKRAGLLKRKAQFSLKVINRGNDWLYVDVKTTKSNDVAMTLPATRLAVPPPEPGQDSDRTLPVVAATRLKTIRGIEIETPLPVEVVRVDAPSVPPLNEEALQGGPALTGAAVLATETREIGPMPEPAILGYHPPIPATVTGFFQAVGRNIKGLVLTALGIVAMLTMSSILFERGFRKINSFAIVEASTDKEGNYVVPNGGSFTVRGQWIDKAEFQLFVEGQEGDTPAEIISSDQAELKEEKKKREGFAISGRVKDATQHIYLATLTPQSIKDAKIIKIVARRRMPILGSLGIFEPAVIRKPIVFGGVKQAPTKHEDPFLTASELLPGQPITVIGKDFGPKGTVVVGSDTATNVSWTDTKIKIPVPADLAASGQAFNVLITLKDGFQHRLSGLHVKIDSGVPLGTDPLAGGGTDPNVPTIPDGGSGGGSTGGTGGGGSTGGSGGGGTSGGGGGTSGGGGTGGGGNSNPSGGGNTTPVVPAPAGYGEALKALTTGGRGGWDAVVSATAGSKNPESIALAAFAYASLRRTDEGLTLLEPLAGKVNSLTPRQQTFFYVAIARLSEAAKNDTNAALSTQYAKLCKDFGPVVSKHLAAAERAGRPLGDGDSFPYLAYASFLNRSGLGSPGSILRKVDPAFASKGELAAAAQLKETP